MNGNVKRILKLVLFICGVIVIGNGSFTNNKIKVYAAEYKYTDAKDGQLTSLKIESSSGEDLILCDDYDGDSTELTDITSYYVRLKGSEKGIKISATVQGKDYVVKLFESDRKNATGHEVGEELDIANGKSTIYIRTFTSKEAYERAQDKDNVTSSDKLYKINIKKLQSDDGQDEIYLDKLTLDGGNIPLNFDCLQNNYSVSVDENVDTIEVKAVPEDTSYNVKLNDNKLKEEDKYKKSVRLNKGENTFKIRVEDNDLKERVYTVKIYRGIAVQSNSTLVSDNKLNENTDKSNQQNNVVQSGGKKINQWIQSNGAWNYNDATGNPIKNKWYSEGNSIYFFKEDGSLAMGWFMKDGHWYYSNELGVRQTGWKNINSEWYYLNSDGIMKTGWFKDSDGKWYYLNAFGAMVRNTTIDGYRISDSGVMI